ALTITSSTFMNIHATTAVVQVTCSNCLVAVSNSMFSSTGGSGYVLSLSSTNVTVSHTNFSSNLGYPIYMPSNPTAILTVISCGFYSNNAPSYAIQFTPSTLGTLSVTGSTFSNNIAVNAGVYTSFANGLISVNNCAFSGNSVSGSGAFAAIVAA